MYEEAVRNAIEEGRRLAQQKKIRSYLDKGQKFVDRGMFEDALKQVTKAFLLDPSHEEAHAFEQFTYTSREKYLQKKEASKTMGDAQRNQVEQIQRKLDEQARQERQEEERRVIREAKVAGALRKMREYCDDEDHEQAMREIEAVYELDPGNAEAQEIETKILKTQKKKAEAKEVSEKRSAEGEAWHRELEEQDRRTNERREELRQESMKTYRNMLKKMWVDGKPSNDDKAMLDVVRRSLIIGDADHFLLERDVQLETYTEALRSAWKSGIITADDVATHENLRNLYGITMEQHLSIEPNIMRELKQV
jgi:tetratricopeptide (TPR) repeat protein